MLEIIHQLNIFDAHILVILREGLTIHTIWFRWMITLISDAEPIIFAVFLVILWLFGTYEKSDGPKHVALDCFWHVSGAFVVYVLLNQLLPVRPRPEFFTHMSPLIDHLPDNSFPSGHAIFWGASWWALHTLFARPKVTWFFFLLGFISCLARIIAGIHYPGDIIVGFFLGWGLVHILMLFPHGKKYRTYAQDIPVRLVHRFLSL